MTTRSNYGRFCLLNNYIIQVISSFNQRLYILITFYFSFIWINNMSICISISIWSIFFYRVSRGSDESRDINYQMKRWLSVQMMTSRLYYDQFCQLNEQCQLWNEFSDFYTAWNWILEILFQNVWVKTWYFFHDNYLCSASRVYHVREFNAFFLS